jgi:hypothetical protein
LDVKLDPGKVDRAEKEIDSFITKRSKAKKQANAEELAYRVEHKKRLAKQQAQRRKEWLMYYRNLYLVHQQRADEFAERIKELQREMED